MNDNSDDQWTEMETDSRPIVCRQSWCCRRMPSAGHANTSNMLNKHSWLLQQELCVHREQLLRHHQNKGVDVCC